MVALLPGAPGCGARSRRRLGRAQRQLPKDKAVPAPAAAGVLGWKNCNKGKLALWGTMFQFRNDSRPCARLVWLTLLTLAAKGQEKNYEKQRLQKGERRDQGGRRLPGGQGCGG